MPPQSRGAQLERHVNVLTSQSSPNLPTIRSFAQQERGRPDQRAPPNVTTPPLNAVAGSDNEDNDNDNDDQHLFSSSSSTTDADDDDNDDDNMDVLRPSFDAAVAAAAANGRSYSYSNLHTTRSHPHLPPSSSQLFPPFYNRPPTPLPPSPSLTSLLRPSFSTHTSHHTTPESSDAESAVAIGTSGVGGSSVVNGAAFPTSAVSKSAASAAAPRAHPKVPTYEYYGFALYMASSGFFLMYLLWAYLPSPFLHQLGIYYYPDRWWALAIPCWLVVLVVYIYVTLASYNTGYLTLPMGSSENIVDEAAHMAVLDKHGRIVRRREKTKYEAGGGGSGSSRREDGRGKKSRQNSWHGTGAGKDAGKHYIPANLGRDVHWQELWNEGTDAVMDVPIGGVCEILYGERRHRDDDEEALGGEGHTAAH